MKNSTPLASDILLAAERRAVATAVFAATGKKVDEDDPIIVAALFQAYSVREAGRESAAQITEAGKALVDAVSDAREAAAEAGAIARQAAAERKATADALEARVRKALKDAGRVQSTHEAPPEGWRGVFAGVAFGLLLAGGLIVIACNFSFAWIQDARIGAEFKRVLPKLEPSLRDELMEYFEKPRQ